MRLSAGPLTPSSVRWRRWRYRGRVACARTLVTIAVGVGVGLFGLLIWFLARTSTASALIAGIGFGGVVVVCGWCSASDAVRESYRVRSHLRDGECDGRDVRLVMFRAGALCTSDESARRGVLNAVGPQSRVNQPRASHLGAEVRSPIVVVRLLLDGVHPDDLWTAMRAGLSDDELVEQFAGRAVMGWADVQVLAALTYVKPTP